MSKDKISTQEVVEAISTQLNISKRAADDFVKTMFSVIEEALMAGESVKIKGFGTFKTQWNAARKSVNVQTGEEFVIEGYYKVSFAPEQGLKDLVNEPFAHLEAVELDKNNATEDATKDEVPDSEEFDGLRIFSEQASEIKDILAEINALTGPNEILEGDAIERIDVDNTDDEIEEENEQTEIPEEEEVWEEEPINEKLETTAENSENKVTITETAIVETVIETEKDISITESTITEIIIEKDQEIIDSETIIEETSTEIEASIEATETTFVEAIIEEKEENESIEIEENEKISNTLQDAVNELETPATKEDIAAFTETFTTSAVAEELPAKNVNSEYSNRSESTKESIENIAAPTAEATTAKSDYAETVSASEILKNNKSRKRIGPILWIFIILFVLIGAVVGTYLFSSAARCWMRYEMLNDTQRTQFNNFRIKTTEWFESASSIFDKKEKETVKVNVKVKAPVVETPKKVIANDTTTAADTTIKVHPKQTEVDLETLFQQPRVYNTYIAEENVREGSRLTRIAERHLGHRDFWVYIYEANRETIKNPDQLPIGKLIRIPKVDSRLIDANNPRCIEYARKLHDQYVKR